MSIRWGLIALGVLAVLSLGACNGGGGAVSSSGLLQGPPSLSGGETSATATATYLLGSSAGSYAFPPIDGFRGVLALPTATVPANARLILTSSLQAPDGAPSLQSAARRPQDTGTLNVYFYTTLLVTSTITFPTLPGFSVTLPATVNPTGLRFFYAISNPKPTNGSELQFRTEGPATVSGQIVTFVPSTTALTLQAGQTYTLAFYAISAIAAAPAQKIYVLNAGTHALTTYDLNGTPTTPMIGGLNNSSAVAVDAAGKIYVVNRCDSQCDINSGSVTTYNADGSASTPTITGLIYPTDVAVDAAGKNIYVLSYLSTGPSAVVTYNANGEPTTPTITATCENCQVDEFTGVAVDAAGKIYIDSGIYKFDGFNLTDFYSTLATYTESGAPSTPTIGGEGNAVVECGVAVDTAGKIYLVSNSFCSGYLGGSNTVTTYTANGTPTTPTIRGLANPSGVAVDAAGKIYVANAGDNTVTTYTANGTPTTPTITGLSVPAAIAVR